MRVIIFHTAEQNVDFAENDLYQGSKFIVFFVYDPQIKHITKTSTSRFYYKPNKKNRYIIKVKG